MKSTTGHKAITKKLLELDPLMKKEKFFPTLAEGASEFALRDPYAFLIAATIDRGRAEINWTVPFWLGECWGHLDPRAVRRFTEEDLTMAFDALPKRPRFWKHAPATIHALTAIVVDEHGGDARGLWLGHSPEELQSTLRRIPHVGPGIASMAVQLVQRVFPGEMKGGDMALLNIKPDVHTRRVLLRLGVAAELSDAAAIGAARDLNPTHPGALDGPLWYVGHTWCHSGSPTCSECFLGAVCPRVAVDPVFEAAPNEVLREPVAPVRSTSSGSGSPRAGAHGNSRQAGKPKRQRRRGSDGAHATTRLDTARLAQGRVVEELENRGWSCVLADGKRSKVHIRATRPGSTRSLNVRVSGLRKKVAVFLNRADLESVDLYAVVVLDGNDVWLFSRKQAEGLLDQYQAAYAAKHGHAPPAEGFNAGQLGVATGWEPLDHLVGRSLSGDHPARIALR